MGAPGYLPDDLELQLAQQQGLAPAGGPTLRAAFAPPAGPDLGAAADAIVNAPQPSDAPAGAPVGLPPLGTPIAAAAPPPPALAAVPGAPQNPLAPPAPPPLLGPGALPKLVTDSKTTTSTTSGVRQTPDLKNASLESRAAAATAKDARAQGVEAEQQRLEGGQDLAHQNAELAAKRREAEEAQQRDMQSLQERHDQAEATSKAQVEQAQKAIKEFKFRDYWDGKSGATRVGSALAVALGAFGAGLTKTPNYALQVLEKEMDDDHRTQVDNLGKLKDEEVMERTGLADARQARQQAIAGLNMKYAGGLRVISSQLEEAAAKSADQNYGKAVAASVAKLKEDAATKDQTAAQLLFQDAFNAAPKTSTTTVTSKKVAEGPGAGGAGGAGSSLAAADAVAKLQADMGSIDRVLGIIGKKPGAWDEFRNNSESWKRTEALGKAKGADTLRSIAQGLGVANVSEEQGLKSAEAKQVYQGMQEALTSIAKGYGGVITEGDRAAAAAGLAILNQNPAEAARTLQRIRGNLVLRMEQYGGIRGIGPQAIPAAPGAAPAGPAPGTTREIKGKTYRFDGRGWLEAA